MGLLVTPSGKKTDGSTLPTQFRLLYQVGNGILGPPFPETSIPLGLLGIHSERDRQDLGNTFRSKVGFGRPATWLHIRVRPAFLFYPFRALWDLSSGGVNQGLVWKIPGR